MAKKKTNTVRRKQSKRDRSKASPWGKLNRNEFKALRVKSIVARILKRHVLNVSKLALTYGMDFSTISRDIDVAKQRIEEFGKLNIKVELGKILRNYDELYLEAAAADDIKSRLIILDKLTHLFNLHKPLQIEFSGTIEHKGVPVSKEELALKNKLLELTGGQAISNN